MTTPPLLRSTPVSGVGDLGLWILNAGGRSQILQNSPRGGRYYFAGMGGVSDSLTDVLMGFLKSDTFAGDTLVEKVVNASAYTKEILDKRGISTSYDPDNPPSVFATAYKAIVDNKSMFISALQLMAGDVMGGLFTMMKGGSMSKGDMSSLAGYAWLIASQNLNLVSSGNVNNVLDPADVDTYLKQKLLVFQVIADLDTYGWLGKDTSSAALLGPMPRPMGLKRMAKPLKGYGEFGVWPEIALAAIGALGWCVLVYIVYGLYLQDRRIRELCAAQPDKCPTLHEKPTDPGDVATKIGYAAIAGLLIYAFVVYGLPKMSEGKASQRAFGA